MRLTLAAAVALAVLSAAPMAACERQRPVVVTESMIRERTTPGDAQSASSHTAATTPYSAETTWELTTGKTWSDYLAWAEPRLLGFARKTDSATTATFVRVNEGDSFTLILEAVELTPRLRVKITWRTSPS
jgi:hypothetical protein